MLDSNPSYQFDKESFDVFLRSLEACTKPKAEQLLQVVQKGNAYSLETTAKASWLGRFLECFYKKQSKRAQAVAEVAAHVLSHNSQYLTEDEALQNWQNRKASLLQVRLHFHQSAPLQQAIQQIIEAGDQAFQSQSKELLEETASQAFEERVQQIEQSILETEKQLEDVLKEMSELQEKLSSAGVLPPKEQEELAEDLSQLKSQLQQQLANLKKDYKEACQHKLTAQKQKAQIDAEVKSWQTAFFQKQNKRDASAKRKKELQQALDNKLNQIEQDPGRPQALKIEETLAQKIFIDANPLERSPKASPSSYSFNAKVRSQNGTTDFHTSFFKHLPFFHNTFRGQEKSSQEDLIKEFDLSNFSQETILHWQSYCLGQELCQDPQDQCRLLELANYIGQTTLQEELEKALLPHIDLEMALEWADEDGYSLLQKRALQIIAHNFSSVIENKMPMTPQTLARVLEAPSINCKSNAHLFLLLYQFAAMQIDQGEASLPRDAISWLNTPISSATKTVWLDFLDLSSIKRELDSKEFQNALRLRGIAPQAVAELSAIQQTGRKKNPDFFYLEAVKSELSDGMNSEIELHFYLPEANCFFKEGIAQTIKTQWHGMQFEFVLKPDGKQHLAIFFNEVRCQENDQTSANQFNLSSFLVSIEIRLPALSVNELYGYGERDYLFSDSLSESAKRTLKDKPIASWLTQDQFKWAILFRAEDWQPDYVIKMHLIRKK